MDRLKVEILERLDNFQMQNVYRYIKAHVNETLEYTWPIIQAHHETLVDYAKIGLETLNTGAGFILQNHFETVIYSCSLLLTLLILCHLLCHWMGHIKAKKSIRKYSSDDICDLAKTAYQPKNTELVMKMVDTYQLDVNCALPVTGMTLFLCACVSGQKRLVSFMLDKGADVGSKTVEGDSPLYLATFAISNSVRMDITLVELLIKAGCNVNAQNRMGNTALHQAAMKGNPVLIRTLLQYGADPCIENNQHIYPIDCAINSGHVRAAELLEIKFCNQNVWDIMEPYTPPRIALGLQSASKHHLVESTIRRKTMPFTH